MIERYIFIMQGLHSLCGLNLKGGTGKLYPLGAEALAQDKAIVEEASIVRSILECAPSDLTRQARNRYRTVQLQLAALSSEDISAEKKLSKRRDLEQEFQQVEVRLASSSHLVAESLHSRAVILLDIARSLPPNAALIDFADYRRWDYSVTCPLRPKGPR